jgi:hypothetical protein
MPAVSATGPAGPSHPTRRGRQSARRSGTSGSGRRRRNGSDSEQPPQGAGDELGPGPLRPRRESTGDGCKPGAVGASPLRALGENRRDGLPAASATGPQCWARAYPPDAAVTWRDGSWLASPGAGAGAAPSSILRWPEMRVVELGPGPLGPGLETTRGRLRAGSSRGEPLPGRRALEESRWDGRPAASATGPAGPAHPNRRGGHVARRSGTSWSGCRRRSGSEQPPPGAGEELGPGPRGPGRGTTRGRLRAAGGSSGGELPPGRRALVENRRDGRSAASATGPAGPARSRPARRSRGAAGRG